MDRSHKNGSTSLENERLRIAASSASFQATTIDGFRKELFGALQQVIFQSRSSNNGGDDGDKRKPRSYDRSHLQDAFEHYIHWRELCKAHDSSVSRGQTKSSTPLNEILTTLMNPVVLPYACSNVLCQVLMHALLQSPRRQQHTTCSTNTTGSRWTHSQLLLLETMVILFNLRPAVQPLLLVEDSFLSESAKIPSSSLALATKWNRFLSATHYLVRECPHVQLPLAFCVLTLLQKVDDSDTEQLQQHAKNQWTRKDGETCPHCSGIIRRGGNNTTNEQDDGNCVRQFKRLKFASLSDLHEDDIASISNHVPKHVWPRYQPSKPKTSFKDVLNMNYATQAKHESRCRCSRAALNRSSASELPTDWRLVRSRGYKKFLGIFHQHPCGRHPLCQGGMGGTARNVRRTLDLFLLLQVTCQQYHSPCLRVCLLLVANALGRNSPVRYLTVVKTCWSQYLQTKNSKWLRIYSEWIVECALFDDRDACWEALRPLAQYIISKGSSLSEPGIYSCMAFVLSRRCRLFQSYADDMHAEFRELVTNLTLYHGDSKCWVHPEMMTEERQRTLETLERVGILGLLDLDDDDEDEGIEEDMAAMSSIIASRDAAISMWPFAKPYDLRSAFHRMGNDVLTVSSESLLSSADHDRDVVIAKKDHETKKEEKEAVPILEYLNDDLLGIVFSFLDYKRLLKIRQVCQMWKGLSDDTSRLWYDAYRSRFELLNQDPRAMHKDRSIGQQSWKQLFVDKWLVEQNIRFRRCQKTGWKHRTCGYLGCLEVLRTPKRVENHVRLHVRKEKKEQEQAARHRIKETVRREKEEKKRVREDGRRLKRKVVQEKKLQQEERQLIKYMEGEERLCQEDKVK
jgi:hypothetical protein